MSKLTVKINFKDLESQLKEKKQNVVEKFKQAVAGLAAATHAHILEQAGEKLKSLQNKYKEAVDFEQIDDNLWVVSLQESAMFIEKGHGSWNMYDSLAKSKKAKTSKEGNKYMAIPFEHSKRPSEQSANAKELTNQIKSFLKKEKINYKKIEYNSDGSPKMGLLHKFDIKSATPANPKHKNPLLQGIAIYQRKDEKGKIKRDVLTFRMISEKNKGDGRWEYKSREGLNLFKEAEQWARDTWNSQLLPALIESLK